MRIRDVGWRVAWALESLENQPKPLAATIGDLLADKARSGCLATFTAEQVCQIIALAYETPPETISHWTRFDLVQEACHQQIVDTISASSIGRFLKSGQSQSTSQPLLAKPRAGRRSGVSPRSQKDLHTLLSS